MQFHILTNISQITHIKPTFINSEQFNLSSSAQPTTNKQGCPW